MKYTILLISFAFFSNLNAQINLSEERKENQKNKVQIFTSEERDTQQIWFHDRVIKMELSEEIEKQYFSSVLFYVFNMSHLNDLDQERTKEEVIKGINNYMVKLNKEVQPILTKEQYQMHLESFDILLKSVHNRLGEE